VTRHSQPSDPHPGLKEIIDEACKAFAKLASSSTSILSSQNAESLSEGSIFKDALFELSVNIPSLYEILSAVIGGTGNKDATIAMIYSMIQNSLNRRLSLVQKLLTVVAIKCHADNQVSLNFKAKLFAIKHMKSIIVLWT